MNADEQNMVEYNFSTQLHNSMLSQIHSCKPEQSLSFVKLHTLNKKLKTKRLKT